MKHFERRGFKESLDKAIASIARAYGFAGTPSTLPKKNIADADNETQENTLLIASLAGAGDASAYNVQSWGVLRAKGTSRVIFTVQNPKHAIAQAFVVKASLATAEAAGLTDCKVLLTSVGDDESRRRYLREAGNFFKKHAKEIQESFPEMRTHEDPDGSIQAIAESDHALAASLPRTIDYLSESSRKVMLETISLLESLGIPYELTARLPYTPEINRELVFAIEGMNDAGEAQIIATGGRFQSPRHGKETKKNEANIIGIAVSVPETLDMRNMESDEDPACFVVHVGEAARLKAFGLLDSLWRARIVLDQAILAEGISDQMQRANKSGAKYVTIIGQREALDGTAILKNVSTQLQETVPLDRLLTRLSRVR